MLERVLEVEEMDTDASAADYDAMDHSVVDGRFADDFLKAADPRGSGQRVLDVGTGTAKIPIEIAKRALGLEIVAVDLAPAMVARARANVAAAGLSHRIEVVLGDGKGLSVLGDARFPAVISNSVVHHVPRPRDLFAELGRRVFPRGGIFVRDLFRPDDEATLARLVETYAPIDLEGHEGHERSVRQRALFADSLRAALTLDEARIEADAAGLVGATIEATSDRHFTLLYIAP